MSKANTIFALATAPLSAGVAVIRVSGPQSCAAAAALCASFAPDMPRSAQFCTLKSATGEVLDQALLLYFKAPNSFTGEDVLEIQCHGGPAVIESILNELGAMKGLRHAEAGEFSKRAFENGKMDLTAAEGLADLIAAQTAEQQKQALRQMGGELGSQFEAWRQTTMELLAHVEAAIDFPDEELDVLAEAGIDDKLGHLIAQIKAALATHAGERLRDGFKIAIVGKPNAGKSTLTNLLTGAETAIVSPIAGTTRDIVSAQLDIGGYPVQLADTAGLRESSDVIEQEGVKRAKAQAHEADVVVLVVSANQWPTVDEVISACLKPAKTLILVSKTDENPIELPNEYEINGEHYPVIGANLTDRTCLPDILQELEVLIGAAFASARSAAMISRKRHRTALQKALEHLDEGLHLLREPTPGTSISDMLAQDLRDAAAAIGSVTGKTGTENVLDLVFSTFCIGK